MNKAIKRAPKEPEMAAEYDFSKGVRGHFTSRIPPGSKLTKLTPAQARRWLAERRKRREAAARMENLLKDIAGSLDRGPRAKELAAIEEHISALSEVVQEIADRAGKSAAKQIKEARSEVNEIQSLFRKFKSDIIRNVRELIPAG